MVFDFCFSLADPQPCGGAVCQTDHDCGGINAGECQKRGNMSFCECLKERGNPDCSYHKVSKNLAGGLQLLSFVGIGGLGHFLLGNMGLAIAQLIILVIPYIVVCLGFCGFFCSLFFDNGNYITVSSGIAGVIACLSIWVVVAGLIWNIVDAVRILQGHVTDQNGYYPY